MRTSKTEPRRPSVAIHIGLVAALQAALLSIAPASALDAGCPYLAWDEYRGVQLLRLPDGSAYMYRATQVMIDADGAPNAYHPDDLSLLCRTNARFKGLDCLPHAGYPKSNWWRSVLVPDPMNSSRPYIQPASSEFAGFFVSQTSLEDSSKAVTDPHRYVDSRVIPYVVFPGRFHRKTGVGTMGDLGYAFNLSNGKQSPFVVAEVGPSNANLGEISIALAEAMGGTHPNAVTGEGSPRGQIIYIVFPNSGEKHKWPLTLEQMQSLAQKMLANSGGIEAVRTCSKSLQ